MIQIESHEAACDLAITALSSSLIALSQCANVIVTPDRLSRYRAEAYLRRQASDGLAVIGGKIMLTRIALSTALVVGTAAAAFAAVEENKIGDIYPVPAYVTQHRASGMDAFAMRPPVVQQRTLQQRTVQRQAAQPRNAQRRAARAVGGFSTTEKMAFARIDAFRW